MKISNKVVYAVYLQLLHIANNGRASDAGLCRVIRITSRFHRYRQEFIDTMREMMTEWPEYSGVPEYPVHTTTSMDARSQYELYAFYGGKYGAARKRLALYLARRLEPHLPAFATRTWRGA